MWSQAGRDRVRRAVNALAQASSIASVALMAAPIVAALLGSAVAFGLGHPWLGAFAAGAAAMVLVVTLLLAYPLHEMTRRLMYGRRLSCVEIALDVDAASARRHKRTVALDSRIIRLVSGTYLTSTAVPITQLTTMIRPATRLASFRVMGGSLARFTTTPTIAGSTGSTWADRSVRARIDVSC